MRDIMSIARETWIDVYGLGHDRTKFINALKHFEFLVRADEREALIDLVDDYAKNNTDLKAAIRARGQA